MTAKEFRKCKSEHMVDTLNAASVTSPLISKFSGGKSCSFVQGHYFRVARNPPAIPGRNLLHGLFSA